MSMLSVTEPGHLQIVDNLRMRSIFLPTLDRAENFTIRGNTELEIVSSNTFRATHKITVFENGRVAN